MFVEGRLARSAANAYTVDAAHLVATMSALSQEMTSPPPIDAEHALKIPALLEEALGAPENDDVIKQGLGHRFCEPVWPSGKALGW